MGLCTDCSTTAQFTEFLNADFGFIQGGIKFVVFATCTQANIVGTLGNGSTLAAWDAALTDTQNFRAFRDCSGITGGVTTTSAAPVEKGSCRVQVQIDKAVKATYQIIFEKDNSNGEVLKYMMNLHETHSEGVYMATADCDGKLSKWIFVNPRLESFVSPQTNAENRTTTMQFNFNLPADFNEPLNVVFTADQLTIPV